MSTTVSLQIVKQKLIESLEQVQRQLAALVQSLPDSLDEFSVAEKLVRDGVLKIGHDLLQGWTDSANARMATPECPACQEFMRHKGYVSGTVVTTLGSLRLRRPRFRCEYCGDECYPHDAGLRFRGHAVSWPLAQVIGRLGAQMPFAQARENLLADYSVGLSKQTMQAICEDAGAALVRSEDEERRRLQSLPVKDRLAALPDSELSPEKAYVFGDGAMIHAAGDWHEIRVASVLAADAEDETLAVDHRARFLSCEDFGWQLLLLARSVGYHRAKLKAFIADGARWLWELAVQQFPDAVQILDWYHLSEHIHATAAVLFGQGSVAAERFSEARLEELWEGRLNETLHALVELRKTCRASAKRDTLRQFINYLENNRQRIDYPRYRALGLRIGSGQVGMRNWTRRGAEGVLRLRAALQTGSYNALWQSPKTAAA